VRFEFRLAEAGEARLEVYDLAGRLVRVLASGAHGAGRHAVAWDGRDARGRAVGGGVLFYRLQAGGRAENRRFVILR
jgi:flagellar hook assembly protein FlgD